MDWNIGNEFINSVQYRKKNAITECCFINECHYSNRWVQTGSLQADSHISSLSWNLEGTRLLTGGVTIQMWHERITNKEEDPARKHSNCVTILIYHIPHTLILTHTQTFHFSCDI